jgi:hypothetical protein
MEARLRCGRYLRGALGDCAKPSENTRSPELRRSLSAIFNPPPRRPDQFNTIKRKAST